MGRVGQRCRPRMFVLKGRFPLDSREQVIVVGRRRTWQTITALERKVRKGYADAHNGAECETWVE